MSKNKVKLHYNIPQLKSAKIAAPVEVLVAGRGMGKTTNILANKSSENYLKTMPRSTGLLINATFTQAYTRTLPELIRGWQKLGYIMDHHFTVCKKPSEKFIKQWSWKGPFAPPIDFKHTVSWFNGAIYQVISQDRAGSTNGMSIDHFMGDEAKLLNYERLVHETMPANRGFVPEFKGNPYHHGFTLTTDMPIGTAGRWILEYAEKATIPQVNEFLELVALEYQAKYFIKKSRGTTRNKWVKALDDIKWQMNELRHGMVYYHEASTLDNIHALGISYIEQQLRDTPLFLFETQILNLRPLRLEDGFYPDFDEEKHGYFSESKSYFDNYDFDVLKAEFDCRKDGDLIEGVPLHIGLDYNKSIHPLEVVQCIPGLIKVINSLQVLYPQKLSHVIKLFNRYYKPHQRSNRDIYYWFDHTATGEQHETRICDDVINGLTKDGWNVIPMYIGNSGVTSTHEARYRMWGKLLEEDGIYESVIRFNRENTNKLILSIQQAGTVRTKDGFAKDKRPEHDPKFPQDEATHHTEALDHIVWGILESGLPFSIGKSTSGDGGYAFGK